MVFLGRRVGVGRLGRSRADARRVCPLGAFQTGLRRVGRSIASAARSVDFPGAVSDRRAAPGGRDGRDRDGLCRLRSDRLDRAEDFSPVALLPAIFDLTQHKLMTMPWFVRAYDKVVAFHHYADQIVAPYKEAAAALLRQWRMRVAAATRRVPGLAQLAVRFAARRRAANGRPPRGFGGRTAPRHLRLARRSAAPARRRSVRGDTGKAAKVVALRES